VHPPIGKLRSVAMRAMSVEDRGAPVLPIRYDAGRRTCGDADAGASKRNDLEGRGTVLR
jgi:hypothetical protein